MVTYGYTAFAMRNLPQLKTLREQQALSLRALAELSGVSHVAISQIERGQRQARPTTLRKLADALGVEPTDLFTESPQGLSPRWDSGEQLKDRSTGELAEMAETKELLKVQQRIEVDKAAEDPRVRQVLIAAGLYEGRKWAAAGKSRMEWYVAGHEPNQKYSPTASGAHLNEELAIARWKLNSGTAEEIEESARSAARAARELAPAMARLLEIQLRDYEALPSHYLEDPSAARRIKEVGAAIASRQLQDLKMLGEFIEIRDQALLKLSTDDSLEARDPASRRSNNMDG